MAFMDDAIQKIKGKAQQLKGDFQIKSGKEITGSVEKLKGKANEITADMKLRSHENDPY